MELQKICGNTYYIPNVTNIGVVVHDNKCLVIDTGLDRQAGRKIVRALDQAGLQACLIINTHSHADHYGGNVAVQKQAGAKVYASSVEKAVMENPILEPLFLFSAAPVKELTTRFLMACTSQVDGILQPGDCILDGFALQIIPLPGHSPGQIGVVTEDNVCFCGDAYVGEAILDKYGMPYTADVTVALETLNQLRQSSYTYYVPSHGAPAGKAADEILQNVSVIENSLEQIMDILQEKPHSREDVLAAFMTANKRKLDPVQYVLNHSTISASLTHLYKTQRAEFFFESGRMLWRGQA